MSEIKSHHDNTHQGGIKDIQKRLMAQDIAVRALRILNHPHNTPDQDQQAGKVQHEQRVLPAGVGLQRRRGRVPVDANVEDGGRDHEEPKGDDLDEEAAQDNVRPVREERDVFGCEEAATCAGVSMA